VFAGNSVYPFQVRVADVLMPLAILFGWPAIFGLALGAGIGNLGADAISGLAPFSIGIDIVGGAFANLVAGFLAWKIGSLRFSTAGKMCWGLGSLALTGVLVIALGPFISLDWVILLALVISGFFAYLTQRGGWNTRYNISWPLATIVETVVISLVVGTYLGSILPFPESTQAAITGVLLGSVVAVNLGGTTLLGAVGRSGSLKIFKSWGVSLYGTPKQEE
jgi:QueT transporter